MLLGMMGSGKTTVGPALASWTIETDELAVDDIVERILDKLSD